MVHRGLHAELLVQHEALLHELHIRGSVQLLFHTTKAERFVGLVSFLVAQLAVGPVQGVEHLAVYMVHQLVAQGVDAWTSTEVRPPRPCPGLVTEGAGGGHDG